MSGLQRGLLIGVCVVAAVLLHTGLCEWYWGVKYQGGMGHSVAGWLRLDSAGAGGGGVPGRSYTVYGLQTEGGVEKADGLVYGTVAPVLLLAAAGHLALGWRRAARRAAGRCPRCGYDLGGRYENGCSECGWRLSLE